MLNPGLPLPAEMPTHIEGLVIPDQGINVGASVVFDHVRVNIRRPFPQIAQYPTNREVALIVGGGPSLNDTLPELRAAVFAGGHVIALNGAYQWCISHNIRPSGHIVMDAQRHNVRFLEPVIPHCKYFFASQCHPDFWEAVGERPDTWMFHAGCQGGETQALLDRHYGGNWFNVSGGTTVASRSLYLLRLMGYLRFELFGIDCCVLDEHHAYAQPENDADEIHTIEFTRSDGDARRFRGSAWHFKQAEDFIRILSVDGALFRYVVHGPGLLAYALNQTDVTDWSATVVDVQPPMALQGV